MLQLHESGLIRLQAVARTASARTIVDETCRALEPFICSTLEARSVEVLAVDRQYLATVEIGERWASGSSVLTARGEGETQQDAVALAAVRAVAPGADVLAAGLTRLFGRGAIAAALVEGQDRTGFAIGEATAIETLQTLRDGWRSNGLLSMGFGGASHRVIRTPALTLVMTVNDRPALVTEADRWLDHVWRELSTHL